jgi:hypothetical protein
VISTTIYTLKYEIRYVIVSLPTGLRAGRPGYDSWQDLGIFLLTTASRPTLEPAQPPNELVPWALTAEVKLPGRKTDHSPPSSAEAKNAWSYTATSPYVFMAWCLVKYRIRLHDIVLS